MPKVILGNEVLCFLRKHYLDQVRSAAVSAALSAGYSGSPYFFDRNIVHLLEAKVNKENVKFEA